MKLIQQTTLYFQEGKSDKVYEVELCKVGDDQYVVNFRYGRRGTALRDGTKTVKPVSRVDADKIFQSLVDAKTKKGYRESPESSIDSAATSPLPAENQSRDWADDPRSIAILDRLTEGVHIRSRWRLSRAVWRAGELGLSHAEPVLKTLIGNDPMLDYCIAWSLGRLGLSSSLPELEQIAQNESHSGHVRHMAQEAVRRCSDESSRQELIEQAIESLPSPLNQFAKNNSVDTFERVLLERLECNELSETRLLNVMYFIDNPVVRPALIKVLQTAPLAPNYFRPIRRIFKTAELRRDAEVFGILAHRFETFRTKFRMPAFLFRKKNSPTVGDNASQAFSVQTRDYFCRRVWNDLRRLGTEGDPDYVPMAVGVLMPFTDDDARNVRTDTRYSWESREFTHVHWDSYGFYWAFNQILYLNSPRYVPLHGRQSFQCRESYEPGADPPDQREEAFPELWTAQPRGLLHLLTDSRCQRVHEFATKAIRDCPEFCSNLDLDVLKILLASPYEVTVELGFELAVQRYDDRNPDRELVLMLADCSLQRARSQAHQWVESNRRFFLEDLDFTVGLITAGYADSRELARQSLGSIPHDEITLQTLVARLIAFLAGLGTEPADSELAADVGEALLQSVFSKQISQLGEAVICDLLAHPLADVQAFAAEVVMRHSKLASSPTQKVLRGLLDATHPAARAAGVKVISNLSDAILQQNIELLAALSCHPMPDIRQDIRPVVKRLADRNHEFAREMVSELIRRLLVPGAPEGVPSHTSRVLREDLAPYLDHISGLQVWRLLQSRSAPAQEVGGFLLTTNVSSEYLEASEIVKLASHDVLLVRQAAWKMFDENVSRMRESLATAVRVLDSKWADSRQFGFEYFRSKIEESDLTPEVLISICDSVREDVQQFGREMITRRFSEQDGPEYLLKLSEHPSQALQLFASNFLQQFGANNPSRLDELSPYFVSILSRVNRGRVAKNRVLEFLKTEATKSREAAEIVSEILSRISATCAVGDKAAAIEAMLEVRERFSDIDLPLELKPLEAR